MTRIALAGGGDAAGDRAAAAAALLALGLCGAAGVWLPLRARARPTRAAALGCALLAALYLALFVPAWLHPPGGGGAPPWPWRLPGVADVGGLLVVAAMLLLLPGGGLVEDPAVPALLYAALLVLGAALTAAAAGWPGAQPA